MRPVKHPGQGGNVTRNARLPPSGCSRIRDAESPLSPRPPLGAGSCRGSLLSRVCPERSGGTRPQGAPLTGRFHGDRMPGAGGRPGQLLQPRPPRVRDGWRSPRPNCSAASGSTPTPGASRSPSIRQPGLMSAQVFAPRLSSYTAICCALICKMSSAPAPSAVSVRRTFATGALTCWRRPLAQGHVVKM
jgi:hypothetical protein